LKKYICRVLNVFPMKMDGLESRLNSLSFISHEHFCFP
jgi:hypothetical protein